MTKKQLVEVIRKVVKIEVNKAVKSIINENKQPGKIKSGKTSLQEVLAQTAEQDDWQSLGEFNSVDARSRFASVQGGLSNNVAGAQSNLLNEPAVQKDESLQKAFTRDYSELVKAMKK